MIKKICSVIMILLLFIGINPIEQYVKADDSGITVYYDNSATNYEKVNIYYWGSTSASWPGVEMEKVDGKENLYKYTVPTGTNGIIFNNGKVQSTDITDIEDNAEYISIGNEGGKDVVMKKDASGNVPHEPTESEVTEDMKKASQINVHIGLNYSNVIVSFTTRGKINPEVSIQKVGSSEVKKYIGTSRFSLVSLKYLYCVNVTDLDVNSQYKYTIGEGNYAVTGNIKTLPKEKTEKIKFAYIADPQVSNEDNAKAAGATFNKLSNIEGLDFTYIAGDITDNSTSELQWENLFNNGGKYANAGEKFFKNNLISVAEGNHDISTFAGHINAPSESGANVYSFDTGYARIIILDTSTAKDEASMKVQKDYLEAKVKEAKEKGLWTIVGFHKPLYTGASHIVDNDLVAIRKYFAPVFSDLDIDLVIQGHDHVYCRGFITAEGNNANLTVNSDGSYDKKAGIPLYMVGGHAGGLKWYHKKEYTVSEGDPLAPNYSFLDKNSIDDGGDVKQEQTYTVFEVTNSEITAKVYNFKYDTATDTIKTDKYLYDSFTLKREVNEDINNGDKDNSNNSTNNTQDDNKISGSKVNNDKVTTGSLKNSNDKNNATINKNNKENGKSVKTEDKSVAIIFITLLSAAGVIIVKASRKRVV